MEIKEIKKIKEKYEGTYQNMDTVNGYDQAAKVMYDTAIQRKSLIKKLTAITCVSIIANLGLVGLLSYKMVKNPYVPYVVSITDTGVVNSKILNQEPLNIDLETKKFFLFDFIKKTRTIYKDIDFYQQQSKEKLTYIGSGFKAKYEDFINNKTKTVEAIRSRGTINVDIKSFATVGKDTYRIGFIETYRDSSGTVLNSTEYSAILQVKTVPVTDEDMAKLNPLGILIIDGDMTVEKTNDFAPKTNETVPVVDSNNQPLPIENTGQ